jgi:hypothetical protein
MIHEANAPTTDRITRKIVRESSVRASNNRKRDEYRPMTKRELTDYLREMGK